MRLRDRFALAAIRALLRAAPRVAAGIEATPPWVFAHAPRWGVRVALGLLAVCVLSVALGVSLNPLANMREVAAIVQKGQTP